MTSIIQVRPKTALEQINDQVQHCLLQFKPTQLVVMVGDSAAIAVCTQTSDKQLPHMIGGVSVQRTGKFRGWEVYANGRAME